MLVTRSGPGDSLLVLLATGLPVSNMMTFTVFKSESPRTPAGCQFQPAAAVLFIVEVTEDYKSLDQGKDGRLTFEEAEPYFTGGINEFLFNKKVLNVTMAYVQADLDRDGSLSLQEWLVFRHFWAPIHLSSVGPLQSDNHGLVEDLRSGPLGGLFKDQNLIQTFIVNIVSVLLAQYQYSSCCECECCSNNCTCTGPGTALVCVPWTYPVCPTPLPVGGPNVTCRIDSCNVTATPQCDTGRTFQNNDGSKFTVFNFVDPCDAKCRWDNSFVREATDVELVRVLADLDLDGTGRISLEEHYFGVFADIDGDGALTPAEYAASLYPAGDFGAHDLNGDGVISFVERKFVSAAELPGTDSAAARRIGLSSAGLTRGQWNFADLPQDFGTFESHANVVGYAAEITVIPIESQYRDLDPSRLDSDSPAAQVRPLGFSYYAILFECALQAVRLYQVPVSQYPWLSSCPIHIYAQNVGPWVTSNSNGEQDGYLVNVWNQVASRLLWNSIYVQTNDSISNHLLPPPIRGKEFGTMSVGLFAQWGAVNSSFITCSRSFAPSLDGLVVVVRSNPPSLSLIFAILTTVPGYAFANLVSFLIVVLFTLGHVFWILERRENSEQFDPLYFKGLIDSAWFLLVAMSTIGYGDKVPATGFGKMLAFFWLFFGVLVFSVFLGNVMSNINTQIAEAAIDGPDKLAGFKVGLYSDEATRRLMLDTAYQFQAIHCDDIDSCMSYLWVYSNVSALLVPYADVLTYAVRKNLGFMKCGSPVRTVGTPILSDRVPAAKICIYSELVYAAAYIVRGVEAQLDNLDKEGYTNALQGDLILSANQGGGTSCVLMEYDFTLISSALVVFAFYGILIGVCSSRGKYFKNKNIRAYNFRGGLSKAPDELALEYGKKWRDLAKQRALERRALGNGGLSGPRLHNRAVTPEEGGGLHDGQIVPEGESAREEACLQPFDSPKTADDAEQDQESPEAFLLRTLSRVGVLTRGQSHDLRRCGHEADAVCRAFSAATWLSRLSMVVLVVLVGGLSYSITAVQYFAVPQYVIPAEL